MPLKSPILLPFLLFLAVHSISQNEGSIQVNGRVLEMPEGKPVADVKVRILGFRWAYTDKDGRFSVKLPSDREYISFELEECPHPVISPLNKLVNIPPHGDLDIKVCAAKNKVLRKRVADLQNDLDRIKQENKLSQRQLSALYARMVDTIAYFQQNIDELDKTILKLKKDSSENADEILRLQNEVEKLIAENRAKEERIKELILERYLLQQKEFEGISKELKKYLAAVRDVQKQLLRYAPTCALGMRPEPCNYFYDLNNKYNSAWKTINLNSEGRKKAVGELWKNKSLTTQLDGVYNYILNNIHGDLFLEKYENSIVRPMGNGASKNKIKKASESFLEELAPFANILENKINALLANFEINI